MKRTFLIAFLMVIGTTAVPGVPFDGSLPFRTPGVLHAEEDWKKEFDDVCASTQDAMLLPVDQLKSLVARCDALKPRIEKLADPQRKVMLKRLQMCRELYVYVLQARENP